MLYESLNIAKGGCSILTQFSPFSSMILSLTKLSFPALSNHRCLLKPPLAVNKTTSANDTGEICWFRSLLPPTSFLFRTRNPCWKEVEDEFTMCLWMAMGQKKSPRKKGDSVKGNEGNKSICSQKLEYQIHPLRQIEQPSHSSRG